VKREGACGPVFKGFFVSRFRPEPLSGWTALLDGHSLPRSAYADSVETLKLTG
jgi:hypothetical protein